MTSPKYSVALLFTAALTATGQTATVVSSPASAGQAAFATISEIVRTLKADPSTNWSRVNIEALRQHLIDMDEVMLRAVVASNNVPGGVQLTITGSGRTAEAIKRMLTSHVASLDEIPDAASTVTVIANGVVLTVTARKASDEATVARIRGLGFAGLVTEGDHHPRHHLMLARGESMGHR